jgi:hypothetical protein
MEAYVMFANEPRAYREAIATAIQELRPHLTVTLVEPELLSYEVRRLAPDLVVCSSIDRVVREASPVVLELYPGHESLARIIVGGRHCSTINDIEFSDILDLIDRKIGDPARSCGGTTR